MCFCCSVELPQEKTAVERIKAHDLSSTAGNFPAPGENYVKSGKNDPTSLLFIVVQQLNLFTLTVLYLPFSSDPSSHSPSPDVEAPGPCGPFGEEQGS